jgi:hypothetical protein
VKTRTITEHLAAVLILAVILGLVALPAQGATLISTAAGGRAWSGAWSAFGSLWDEMVSLLNVRWGLGPGATARDGRAGTAKAAAASTGGSGDSSGPSGVSNSTINPDGAVSLNP